MFMGIALYAGSFDPVTYGHLDIIKSGAEIFDKVIVAVAYNSEKQCFIPVSDRLELIKGCVKDFGNVEVSSYEGLTVDFARQNNVSVLLRGIRNAMDYEYEKELAVVNSKLNDGIKTVLLFAKPEHSCVSSSNVREIYNNNGNLSNFVPDNVIKYLKNKL